MTISANANANANANENENENENETFLMIYPSVSLQISMNHYLYWQFSNYHY